VQVLAEPGQAYAGHVAGSGLAVLALRLPAGSYRARWFDPVTGNVLNVEQLEATAALCRVMVPKYKDDLALELLRSKP
jgi:hypothetical protein